MIYLIIIFTFIFYTFFNVMYDYIKANKEFEIELKNVELEAANITNLKDLQIFVDYNFRILRKKAISQFHRIEIGNLFNKIKQNYERNIT